MSTLGAKASVAALWGTAGSFLRLALQFATQILLARILGPEQYGLFALAFVFITFSHMFSDMGFAYGLVQRQTVTDRDIRFVVTRQWVFGSVVTAFVFLAGDPITEFFGDARAGDVVQALAIICLLHALAAPSLNLLRRELNYRSIMIAQLVAFSVGYILVGIPLALNGAQVWALVAASVTQSLLALVLMYRARPHPLKPLLRHEDAKALSSFGVMLMLTNLTSWFILNIDRILIGRLLQVREVGLYSTTFNILYTPSAALLDIVQPVFFSASSRVMDEQQKIATSHRALMAGICTYVLPVFAAVAAIGHTFVLALYGADWAPAAQLVAPLALAMPLMFMVGLTSPMLWTGGYRSMEFKIQVPLALVWGMSCWFAAQHSIAAVAWSILGLCVLRFALILGTATRRLGLAPGQIWRAMAGGVLCSCLVGLAVWLSDQLAAPVAPFARLLLDFCVAGAVLVLVLRLAPRLIAPELAQLTRQVLARMPSGLKGRLAFLGRDAGDLRA